jgi:predicted dehydrogenase
MNHTTNKFSRRQLLKIGAAGTMALPCFIPSGILAADGKPGPNERVGVGIIGTGRRGTFLCRQMPDTGRVVALCDVNLPHAEACKKENKGDWPIYQHYQEVLDRKDIDGVIMSMGDFQRVRPCIQACLAGKDVYAEKPLCLYIREGRALVNAVRKCNRVCQVGTQTRSMAINRLAWEFVRDGGLGQLKEVLVRTYSGSGDIIPLPEEKVPQGLDWDAWLNQAAFRPFNNQWMSWEQWYDFCGGWMTNWGAHGIDMVQAGLGMDQSGPVETRPLTPGANGQCEARYANGVSVRFVLGTDAEVNKGPHGGCIYVGEKGKLEINRNTFKTNPKEIGEELRKKIDYAAEVKKWRGEGIGPEVWGIAGHIQNWFDCMATREKPNADVEIGHRTISVSHLMNITRRLGRALKWDPGNEQFIGDDEANKMLERPRRKGYELPSVG